MGMPLKHQHASVAAAAAVDFYQSYKVHKVTKGPWMQFTQNTSTTKGFACETFPLILPNDRGFWLQLTFSLPLIPLSFLSPSCHFLVLHSAAIKLHHRGKTTRKKCAAAFNAQTDWVSTIFVCLFDRKCRKRRSSLYFPRVNNLPLSPLVL
jgi:hypothetical protein